MESTRRDAGTHSVSCAQIDFVTVVRQPDIAGHEVWTHTSPDQAFSFTLMTVSAVAEQRYERLLLRDNQPRSQSWDGRWNIRILLSRNSATRINWKNWSSSALPSWTTR